MDWIIWLLTGLFVGIAVLMTFLILLQEGKGGGLAALGGTKAAGVEGVTNPIRRATAWLAGIFFFIAILLGVISKPEASADFLGNSDSASSKTETPPAPSASGATNLAPQPAPTPVQVPVKALDTNKPADKSLEKPADKSAEKTQSEAAPPLAKSDQKAVKEQSKVVEPKKEEQKLSDTPNTSEPKKEELKTSKAP